MASTAHDGGELKTDFSGFQVFVSDEEKTEIPLPVQNR
jgi:hypothetical protein